MKASEAPHSEKNGQTSRDDVRRRERVFCELFIQAHKQQEKNPLGGLRTSRYHDYMGGQNVAARFFWVTFCPHLGGQNVASVLIIHGWTKRCMHAATFCCNVLSTHAFIVPTRSQPTKRITGAFFFVCSGRRFSQKKQLR